MRLLQRNILQSLNLKDIVRYPFYPKDLELKLYLVNNSKVGKKFFYYLIVTNF